MTAFLITIYELKRERERDRQQNDYDMHTLVTSYNLYPFPLGNDDRFCANIFRCEGMGGWEGVHKYQVLKCSLILRAYT